MKIALELERALVRRAVLGTAGGMTHRVLAHGDGWLVRDVVCTAGPADRPFEETHSTFYIAVVVAGSFQYRSRSSQELMTPGSLLLGNPGQLFTCGHEHGTGDRCLSFGYAPEYFESVFADVGGHGRDVTFPILRVPPLRELAPLVARSWTGLARSAASQISDVSWEELALHMAAQAVRLIGNRSTATVPEPSSALARITRTVRSIEQRPDSGFTVNALARDAGLSPFHFLRLFGRVTGVTPHQYILRTRMREAALRLSSDSTRILDIALDCGFGDVSNFNRTFRSEFGCGPREFRRRESRC